MKRFRIGNDLYITWAIYRDGEAESFEGKTLKLLMRTMSEEIEVTDYTIDGNILKWTFYGKDQTRTTTYTFTLIENDGEEGMYTVDACKALRLVKCTCEVDETCCDFTVNEDSDIGDSSVDEDSNINIGQIEGGTSTNDSYFDGYNSVTSIIDIPVDKWLVVASINESATLSLSEEMTDGRELRVVVNNTSENDITVTLPNEITLTINRGQHGYIDIIYAGGTYYFTIISQGTGNGGDNEDDEGAEDTYFQFAKSTLWVDNTTNEVTQEITSNTNWALE